MSKLEWFYRHDKCKSRDFYGDSGQQSRRPLKQCVVGLESLQGGPERSLYEAGKVKPKLQRRPQDGKDAKTMEYSLRKIQCIEYSWA